MDASRALVAVALLVVPVAVAGVSACASLDGLTGGPGDASTDQGGGGDGPLVEAGDDGSPATDSGAPLDAPADTRVVTDSATPGDSSTADSGGSVDSGSFADAGDASDGGGAGTDAGFCVSQSPPPTFCADFDTAFPGGWSVVSTTGGTTAADTVDFVSAPTSYRATSNPLNAGQVAQLSLQYDVPSPGTTVHLEYQLRAAQIDPNAGVVTGGLAIGTNAGNGPDAYDLYLVVTGVQGSSATSAVLQESFLNGGTAVYQGTALGTAPTTGQWMHVEIDVVLPGGSSSASWTVHMNGALVATKPLFMGGAAVGGGNGPMMFTVGLDTYPQVGVGPSELEIDNALLRVSP